MIKYLLFGGFILIGIISVRIFITLVEIMFGLIAWALNH